MNQGSEFFYYFRVYSEQPKPPRPLGHWFEVGWYFTFGTRTGNLKRIFYHNRRPPPRSDNGNNTHIGPYRTYADVKLAAINFNRSCPVALQRANEQSLQLNPNLNYPDKFRVAVSPASHCRDPRGAWEPFVPTSERRLSCGRPYRPQAVAKMRRAHKDATAPRPAKGPTLVDPNTVLGAAMIAAGLAEAKPSEAPNPGPGVNQCEGKAPQGEVAE